MDVPEIQLSDASPKSFWRDFVSKRQPVVIHGIADNWSSFNDHTLVEKAGDAVVVVEHRSGSSDAYGQGKKSAMQLRDFIARMQKGDCNLYLSTQEVGVGHDGHPLLYGAPLVDLQGCFPLQQPLLGELAPQSINMWMGCAPEGSSSGLHHDFHDNLYILLRGSKRFRLYPPSSAPDMYVMGRVKHIFPNGRIVYEGQGDIQPDGSNLHDVKLWQAHNAADRAAAAAATAADAAAADNAEALLEQQLDLMLEEGALADDEDGLADDYIDSDGPSSSHDSGSSSDDDAADDNKPHNQRRSSKRQQRPPQQRRQQKQGAAAVPAVAEAPPPSFSQVQLGLPEADLRQRFPRFPGLAAASVVVLQAGDMLYLPAGWFHEVTSYGGPGLDGGHLAINYWYHPPDNLDPSKAGFRQPYSSPYYPTVWAHRRGWVQAETRAWWQQQRRRLAQHQQQQAPTSQQQQQPQQGGSSSAAKRRRINWAPTVAEPGNVYAAFNTRPGTATGSCRLLPQHSGLRDPTASSDDSEPESDTAPDDEQQHHHLGKEVADGIDALEAYFGEDAEAMNELLGQFLAERRARLAASSGGGAGMETTPLPRLRGRRHHYTVVVKMAPRRPKPKPQRRSS